MESLGGEGRTQARATTTPRWFLVLFGLGWMLVVLQYFVAESPSGSVASSSSYLYSKGAASMVHKKKKNSNNEDIWSLSLRDIVEKQLLNHSKTNDTSYPTTANEWFEDIIQAAGGDEETALSRTRDAIRDSLQQLQHTIQTEALTVNHKKETYAHKPFHWAACLIVKNANAMLPEWLAYHYTVLPLRRLILAVDPFSLDRPDKEFLEQFGSVGLNITVWDDDWYIVDGRWARQKVAFIKNYTSLPSNLRTEYDDYQVHLWRQSTFYGKCLETLKMEGYSWTATWDLDEYLFFNYFVAQEVEEHIISAEAVQAIHQGTSPRGRLPHPRQNRLVTAAEFIASGIDSMFVDQNCIVFPRLVIGPTESSPSPSSTERTSQCASCDWNVSRYLYTYRFHHHRSVSKSQGQAGKSMVDLSRVAQIPRAPGPHSPLASCGYHVAHWSDKSFRFHHYSGSSEQYALKQRISQALENVLTDPHVPLDRNASVPDWLPHFVEAVGNNEELAFALTQKAIQNGLTGLKSKIQEVGRNTTNGSSA